MRRRICGRTLCNVVVVIMVEAGWIHSYVSCLEVDEKVVAGWSRSVVVGGVEVVGIVVPVWICGFVYAWMAVGIEVPVWIREVFCAGRVEIGEVADEEEKTRTANYLYLKELQKITFRH